MKAMTLLVPWGRQVQQLLTVMGSHKRITHLMKGSRSPFKPVVNTFLRCSGRKASFEGIDEREVWIAAAQNL